MRRLVDVTILAAVLAVAGLVWTSRPRDQAPADRTAAVRESLTRLYHRTSYHAALQHPDATDAGHWPATIDPGWFRGTPPRNAWLADADDRPWLDIAPPGDDHPHPPDPVIYRKEQAQFWYNPRLGVFRARLPSHLGEARALSLYNQIHGMDLAALDREADPARTPLSYTPGRPPAAAHASGFGGERVSTSAAGTPPSAADTAGPAPRVFRPAGRSMEEHLATVEAPPPEATPAPPPPRRTRLRKEVSR